MILADPTDKNDNKPSEVTETTEGLSLVNVTAKPELAEAVS